MIYQHPKGRYTKRSDSAIFSWDADDKVAAEEALEKAIQMLRDSFHGWPNIDTRVHVAVSLERKEDESQSDAK